MTDNMHHKPSVEEKQAIDGAIENALALLPQMIAGDMQGAMNKLHSQDKPAPAPKKEPERKAPPVKEPPKPEPKKEADKPKKEADKPQKEAGKAKDEKGFLKSLFGKK